MTVQRTNKLTGATSSEKLVVQKKVLLDQTALKSAEVITNKFDENPEIRIVLTAEGQKRFAEVTRQNIHNRLAIVIDGKLVTAPVIQSEIPSGMFQITGNYTEQEAEELAKKINDAVKR